MTTTNINAVLASAHPPLAVITTTASVTFNPGDGTAVIAQRSGHTAAITVAGTVLCAGGSALGAVTLALAGKEYPMAATAAPDQYSATIPAVDVSAGTLSITFTCEGSPQTVTVGSVTLYAPTGRVADGQTGEPVAGALVTLYQVPAWEPRESLTDTTEATCESNLSKDAGDPWSQPAPTGLGLPVNLDVTPLSPPAARQTTGGEGYYGWDLPPGCWYVTVVAPGYEPLTGPVVGVPTAVTDLNLSLTPLPPPPVFLPVTLALDIPWPGHARPSE